VSQTNALLSYTNGQWTRGDLFDIVVFYSPKWNPAPISLFWFHLHAEYDHRNIFTLIFQLTCALKKAEFYDQ
jgi:hypothetical protein